jgi:hypothetical protein
MKIGGHNEFWMIIGPVIAVVLVASVTLGGPDEIIRLAERLANEGWNFVANTLR